MSDEQNKTTAVGECGICGYNNSHSSDCPEFNQWAHARIEQLEAENEKLREQFVQPVVDYLDGKKCLTDLKPMFDAARALKADRK